VVQMALRLRSLPTTMLDLCGLPQPLMVALLWRVTW